MDLIAYEFKDSRAYIVLELGEIDLKTFIRETPFLSEHRVCSILEDMCTCIQALHELNFIHNDLKPQNFMFSKGRIKLIDFGISKLMKENETSILQMGLVGTPKYMSPETVASNSLSNPTKKIHRASDVWSLGVIAYEMINGQSPFDELMKGKTPIQFLMLIRDGQFKINWNIKCSDSFKQLLQGCLQYDDMNRLSTLQILRHPAMQ